MSISDVPTKHLSFQADSFIDDRYSFVTVDGNTATAASYDKQFMSTADLATRIVPAQFMGAFTTGTSATNKLGNYTTHV